MDVGDGVADEDAFGRSRSQFGDGLVNEVRAGFELRRIVGGAGDDQVDAVVEAVVAAMQARARQFAGRQRDHTPTPEHPFTVVMVDEIAFLTAYQADRKLRERTLAALATLTTQGPAVGFCVVAALQDPRKEVLNIRNLFPDKIALRLDEPSQADLVLSLPTRSSEQASASSGSKQAPTPSASAPRSSPTTTFRVMVTDYTPGPTLAALTAGEAA